MSVVATVTYFTFNNGDKHNNYFQQMVQSGELPVMNCSPSSVLVLIVVLVAGFVILRDVMFNFVQI